MVPDLVNSIQITFISVRMIMLHVLLYSCVELGLRDDFTYKKWCISGRKVTP